MSHSGSSSSGSQSRIGVKHEAVSLVCRCGWLSVNAIRRATSQFSRLTRVMLWPSAFLLVTAAALALAIYEIIKTLAEKPTDQAAAIGELLLVIVLAIGEVLAFLELRHIAKEREFNSWLKAQDVWNDEGFRTGRGKIFQRLRDRNRVWSRTEREEALDICRRMDEFAHLAAFLGRRRMLNTWDDPVAKAWIVLEAVVFDERVHSRWRYKWNTFELLGRDALAKLVREGRDPRPT
jgi:hypothetical protein